MEKSIGVFDSGLGGLTSVKELSSLMPHENIVYLGDTARVPYGSRSPEIITRFAKQDLAFILKQNLKAVLVACGTISSVALPALRESCPVFLTGVVSPAASAAAKTTKNGKIAVIATSATILSGSYKSAIAKHDGKINILEKACPLFVPLVETGYYRRGNKAAEIIVSDYLSEIRAFGADTVILGCTHYPILRPLIADFLGEKVTLIDSGKEAARVTAEHIKASGIAADEKNEAVNTYFVTDEQAGFTSLAELFLDRKISGNVKKIGLEEIT